MRRLLGGLCLAVAALLFSSPVAALDCVIKPTEIDRLLCSSDRLDYADDAMCLLCADADAILIVVAGGPEAYHVTYVPNFGTTIYSMAEIK